MGLILRQKGDLAGAAEAFEAALRADPSDISACLEGGDTFFEADRWEEARRWYERALAKDPSQAWAKPSSLFCEWKLSGAEEALAAVTELAGAGNGRAQDLLNRAYDGPFVPSDASANLLRQFLEQGTNPKIADGSTFNIGISSLEAPSNGLAFALAYAAKGLDLTVRYGVAKVQAPDPRQPLDAVQYRLWEYEGTVAKQALPEPPERIRQAIAELASGPFNRIRSFARASLVAAELGPQALPGILATMVHPPQLPAGRDALEYLPRVQFEAMCVAAQVDEGWQGSARRAALMSVLLGPMDWTVNAAIDVLTFLADRHPVIAYDVHKAFEFLERNRPEPGYCCWVEHLYNLWQRLPLLSDEERDELQKKLMAERDTG